MLADPNNRLEALTPNRQRSLADQPLCYFTRPLPSALN